MCELDPIALDASIRILEEELQDLKSNEDRLLQTQEELYRQLREVHGDIEGNRKVIQEADKALRTKQSLKKQRENTPIPAVALPPEILSTIFYETIDNFEDALNGELCSAPMSLVLSWVCRRWKTIVVENPRYWTCINLHHCLQYNLAPYLSRSAGFPLSIMSGVWDEAADAKYDDCWRAIHHFVSQFGNHAHRWQRMVMTGFDSPPLMEICYKLSKARPRTLRVIDLSSDQATGRIMPHLGTSYHSNLRTLNLKGIHIPDGFIAPKLEFLTLRGTQDNFTVQYANLHQFLVSTTLLSELDLDVGLVEFNAEEVRSISLPNLRKLGLFFTNIDSQQLRRVLTMISAPALDAIELKAADDGCYQKSGEGSDFKSFSVDGKPRYPTVARAIFSGVVRDHEDFEDLVHAFPNIERVNLSGVDITLCISVLEQPGLDKENLSMRNEWPNLKALDLSALAAKSCFPELCKWLQRRWDAGCCRVALGLMRDLETEELEDREWLAKLDELGPWMTLSDRFNAGGKESWERISCHFG
ncbi:hypothetical protein HYDPIDRAFT_33318 [Hydnomerulius pinastri MD-312]|uniref:F-box domain-containing protein n=1 Tax=Hydnomerulius pinastri MD-312 TaxID=994086 RepID=A0A0C9W8G3_9AGAM|nr:hypothetical protein HYDPIDRAFT_33318 [Hydnomerulius pinastri MD-312]